MRKILYYLTALVVLVSCKGASAPQPYVKDASEQDTAKYYTESARKAFNKVVDDIENKELIYVRYNIHKTKTLNMHIVEFVPIKASEDYYSQGDIILLSDETNQLVKATANLDTCHRASVGPIVKRIKILEYHDTH